MTHFPLEPWPDLYIKHLCDTFDLCKRVLKPTGSLWVNIADSRWNAKGSCFNPVGGNESWKSHNNDKDKYPLQRGNKSDNPDIPVKSMVGIPERFMIEMIRRGWVLRNKIIWQKRNCMPSSSSDRFTDDYELLYFFTLSKKYFFEMQYEGMRFPDRVFNPDTSNHKTLELAKEGNRTTGDLHDGRTQYGSPSLGRHMRSVWDITTKGYKGGHHAVFPPELCTTPILATCPEFVCTKCGKPRMRIYKKVKQASLTNETYNTKYGPEKTGQTLQSFSRSNTIPNERLHSRLDAEKLFPGDPASQREYINTVHDHGTTEKIELVGLSDCGCSAGFKPGIVLDLFGGSGTVALEARRLGRIAWLIDISEQYAKESVKRVLELPNPFD